MFVIVTPGRLNAREDLLGEKVIAIIIFAIILVVIIVIIIIFFIILVVIIVNIIIFFIIMYNHTEQVPEEEEGEKGKGRAEASLKENTRKETSPPSYFSYVL